MPACYPLPLQRLFFWHLTKAQKGEARSLLLSADQFEHVCCLSSLLRWMADGGSGAPSERARGPVEVGYSWLRGSATTLYLLTGANTARGFGSSTDPATYLNAQILVRT